LALAEITGVGGVWLGKGAGLPVGG